MDKMKGLAKGGWHPSGDKQIHRDTWKSDLKGMATGKKKDPYEEARSHQSAPLTTLRDPATFAPPPKHSAYYGLGTNAISRTGTASSAGSSSVGGPAGGWGSSVVEPGYAQRKREQEELQRQQMEAEQAQQASMRGPYRADTTGLRTDHLPKPPARRPRESATPARTASPSLPPRQSNASPAVVPPRAPPPRQIAPPPSLPPRQNEYPDEHTPPPPPSYNEALHQPAARDPALINPAAAQRLGQAGVSIAGFGIGNNHTNTTSQESPASARGPPAGQLGELQQRFARMNTGAASEASSPIHSPSPGGASLAGAAQKKAPPPPPPPKRAALSAGGESSESALAAAPPPVPMSSKPRPS
ncbi:Hypothetical predicted protein [Lecanosticta acicola]|uniref:Uncharacterized protein n=1 Tax=Lecanosticta acicola TaxID=111012 RepID=A0AAI8YRT0_9PEZI|nr:Hypothetical predicted protein [Lecanosticta acicola]